MENQGWIKLHRKMLNNPISKKPVWAWLWVFLLMKANHEENSIIWNGQPMVIKRGQLLTGLIKITKESGVKAQSIRSCIKYLKLTNQITVQTTNKWSLISINNYDNYQEVTNKVTNKEQTNNKQITTNKNDNNDNKLITKVIKDKVRDEIVDFILDEFRKRYNFSPIDKKPRQVAYNISQLTRSFIKKYGIAYEQKKGEKPDVKMIIKRVFDKYAENEYSQNTQYLDTFKRHLKKILEITGNKLITNS